MIISTVTKAVIVIKIVSILLVLAVSVYSLIHQYGCIWPSMDLNGLSLNVPSIKFVLSAVSPNMYTAFYGITRPFFVLPTF